MNSSGDSLCQARRAAIRCSFSGDSRGEEHYKLYHEAKVYSGNKGSVFSVLVDVLSLHFVGAPGLAIFETWVRTSGPRSSPDLGRRQTRGTRHPAFHRRQFANEEDSYNVGEARDV
jgi:hypothetical protein